MWDQATELQETSVHLFSLCCDLIVSHRLMFGTHSHQLVVLFWETLKGGRSGLLGLNLQVLNTTPLLVCFLFPGLSRCEESQPHSLVAVNSTMPSPPPWTVSPSTMIQNKFLLPLFTFIRSQWPIQSSTQIYCYWKITRGLLHHLLLHLWHAGYFCMAEWLVLWRLRSWFLFLLGRELLWRPIELTRRPKENQSYLLQLCSLSPLLREFDMFPCLTFQKCPHLQFLPGSWKTFHLDLCAGLFSQWAQATSLISPPCWSSQ